MSVIFMLGGCAQSTVAPESSATPAPAATPPPAVTEKVDHHEFFDKAVRAMEKMGRVENADFDHGLIQGVTHSGVSMEIEIVFHDDRTPELNVQAELPDGMTGLGTINEPDRYMAIFREMGSRR